MAKGRIPGKRAIIRIEVSPESVDHIHYCADRFGMPQIEIFSRAVEFLVRQPPEVSFAIITGQTNEEKMEALIKILNTMARRNGSVK